MAYLKGISRFNYWEYPAVNPLLCRDGESLEASAAFYAHQDLSAQCGHAHTAGDTRAIFECAKADVWAFREAWVVAQIESWRQEKTPAARKKLHKLMRTYTDERGRDSLAETVRQIWRDQGIFKAVVTRNQQGTSVQECFFDLAEQHALGVESVKEIYLVYKQRAG
jgi:hypothetical protein